MAEADVVIVGGGVVGCSVLFELNRLGYECILLEKNDNLMSEASSGNSGMLHTGFDAPENSLELHCIKKCVTRAFGVFDTLGVPYNENGSVMVAWNQEQVLKLDEIRSSSLSKGLTNVNQMSIQELYKREPYLQKKAQGSLWISGESVLEPCVYGLLLAHHAKKNGAQILTGCHVEGYYISNNGKPTLKTSHGKITAGAVINCAGLHGDTVQNMADINSFSIKPRKGQYTVFGSNTGHFIQSSILPVPTEKTKGIIVFKTVHNNLIVGPTAEDVDSREKPSIDPSISQHLKKIGYQTLPPLSSFSPIGHYTGVRPATEYKDYQIKAYPERKWITVGGIRSTGVSGSLGIAEFVAGLLSSDLGVEPSRGSFHTLQRSEWKLNPDGSLLVDDYVYGVCHPITLFGIKEASGNSRL